MDEHTLKDIGLRRSVACAEGRRWFWDIPPIGHGCRHEMKHGGKLS
jgi:hypothetical protein